MKHIPKLVLTYVFGQSRLPHSVLLSVFFLMVTSVDQLNNHLLPYHPPHHHPHSRLPFILAVVPRQLCMFCAHFQRQFCVFCVQFAISSLCFVLTLQSVLCVLCSLCNQFSVCYAHFAISSLCFVFSLQSVLCVLCSLCNQFSVFCAHFAISSLCFVLTF